MTGTDIALVSLIVGLLGAGGGIWAGGRGKVSEKHCETRHKGQDEDLKEIKHGIENLQIGIDKIHGRITDGENRISHIEGRLNGGHHV